MIIQASKINGLIPKVIKSYNSSFITTYGPNIISKLDLSDVEINYESEFVSRMTLNEGAMNQPILFGFLGSEVTFLLLKITYNENSHNQNAIEENQYIEYYYKDQPNTIRFANKLLLLTGNSTNRIPQIFLNNPSPDFKVYIDVMVGNLPQSDIILSDVSNVLVTFENLYHNSIISDTFWNSTDNVSGSTQFQIVDLTGKVQMFVDYTEIDSIEQIAASAELIIRTKSETIIQLYFISAFEMYQARSRMNWVTQKSFIRYLSTDLPSVDLTPPVITINSSVVPISGSTYYAFPVTPDPITSGYTILPPVILNYFVHDIQDDRDGVISISDATITIRQHNFIQNLTGITSDGIYDITISITDVANNTTIAFFTIIVDTQPPVINFNTGIDSGFTMTIPDDTRVPASGITHDDIIRKTIFNVIDNVDGLIANSAVTISISGYSQSQTIAQSGEYSVKFSVSDTYGNISSYNKYMFVTGNIIINAGDVFTMSPALTSASFIYSGVTGTTATMIISGETFLIANSGNNLVFDYSGITQHIFTYTGETYTLTINSSVFSITFTAWGSLYFNINNIAVAPQINLGFVNEYRLYTNTGYTSIVVSNTGNTFGLNLDGNSGSTNDIRSNNITTNYGDIVNTPVYLSSFVLNDNTSGITSGTTSGTSLFEYYATTYPNFDLGELDQILLGNLPFANLFEHNENIDIDDTISGDTVNRVVILGNYPTGIYNYAFTLINGLGYTNKINYQFIIG